MEELYEKIMSCFFVTFFYDFFKISIFGGKMKDIFFIVDRNLLFFVLLYFIEWKNRNNGMCIKGNKKKILICLSMYDYCRPSQIARCTGIHKNTVSNVLSKLKKEGLVYCLNPEYHVPRLYRLTSEGKKKIKD